MPNTQLYAAEIIKNSTFVKWVVPGDNTEDQEEDKFFFMVLHEKGDFLSPVHSFDESLVIKFFVVLDDLLADFVFQEIFEDDWAHFMSDWIVIGKSGD